MDYLIGLFVVVAGGVAVVLYLINRLTQNVPEESFGVAVTRNFSSGRPELVAQGEIGVQPQLLPSGGYLRRPFRSIEVHPLVIIPEGAIGVVTSHVGSSPADVILTAPYNARFGDFTDLEAFLAGGGQRGVQEAVLPPGTYAIHPYAFEVLVIDEDGECDVYGARASATDDLAAANPFVVMTSEFGALLCVQPDSGTAHPTPAMLLATSGKLGGHKSATLIVSPTHTVTIEWEVSIPLGDVLTVESLLGRIQALAGQAFTHFRPLSPADFIAGLSALERQVRQDCPARITEAVMRLSCRAQTLPQGQTADSRVVIGA